MDQIKAVASLGIGVVEVLDSAADGVSFNDVFQLIGLMKKVKPAVDAVSSGTLLDAFKSLDDAAKAELSVWFNEELDISNDKVEEVIEKSWEAALSLVELLKVIKP